MSETPSEFVYREWLMKELFEQAPLNIALIDRNFHIIETNGNFVHLFGEGRGRECWRVYKGRETPCTDCAAARTFEDGRTRINEEVGVDCHGHTAYYLVHIVPVRDRDGSIPFIVEMSTDITESKRLKLEYQTLFEQVPCYVTVINEDLRVVRANRHFREVFGEVAGQKCHEIFKRSASECEVCPARETFADGKTHTAAQHGLTKDGRPTHYIVTTAPASRSDRGFSHVIEMAIDVTQLRNLRQRLRRAEALRKALVENSPDGILGTGPFGKTLLMNPAAEALLGLRAEEILGGPFPPGLLPEEFYKVITEHKGCHALESAQIHSADGTEIPVRLSVHAMDENGDYLGAAAFLQDLRKLRQLEREKIDAERLAAVGQTVASLAHGIKNILTGLEGGMYFLKSGLKGGRQDRLEEGWGMLERNMEKISSLVRNLLAFSKGRVPKVEMVDPIAIADEIVELFREAAARAQVQVRREDCGVVERAPLDAGAIHTCLANLVSNAVDACQMSDRRPCNVTVRVFDDRGSLVFEVEDEGCGMDQEVRQLAFTNFFTTKGSGGTGLGLLQTRKLTQEHGGRIAFETTPGRGSAFRLLFPRDKLPALTSTAQE
ncbi:MAG: PAS domain-containing protein [Planctomycetota bacterium]